jgi:hypothetical protein
MAEIVLPFDPANFVGGPIDNQYFPMLRGNKWVYEEVDGPVVTERVTGETKNILGVNCTVVTVVEKEDGKVIEKTKDYYAQDVDGNVWYLGEDSRAKLEDGGWTTEGTWRAGVDGATPGIIMLADPEDHIGDTYVQENAPGVAEDFAEVVSLTADAVVPFGSFIGECLQTEDTNPLDGDVENKFLVSGIGVVLTEGITEGGDEELVSFTTKGGGTVNLANLVQSMASFSGRRSESGALDSGVTAQASHDSGLSQIFANNRDHGDHGRDS